jgi:hypothetical protein
LFACLLDLWDEFYLNLPSDKCLCDIAGESPLLSSPYVDSSNNHSVMGESFVNPSKGDGSPHVAGNHIISARHHPHFLHVLQYVSCKECIFVLKDKINPYTMYYKLYNQTTTKHKIWNTLLLTKKLALVKYEVGR